MKDIRQKLFQGWYLPTQTHIYFWPTQQLTKKHWWDNAVFEGHIRGYFCGYLGTQQWF